MAVDRTFFLCEKKLKTKKEDNLWLLTVYLRNS